jgi:competence protein ComEC
MPIRRSPFRSSVVPVLLLLTVVLLALSLSMLSACLFPTSTPTPTPIPTPTGAPTPTAGTTGGPTGAALPMLEVRFLDVGQADSILIRVGETSMLIDAGNNDDGKGLVAYLKDLGITRFEAVVGTHPHEDHIGGLDKVVAAFDVGRIYLPKVSNDTKTFEDLLDAVAAKGLKVNSPAVGTTLSLGEARIVVLSPSASLYDGTNLHSIVLRLTYGSRSFLFCADAESGNESEMLASGLPLSADVMKIGHHGSTSSSTTAFLAAVAPKIAVIPVGAGNTYDHPAQQTLDRLSAIGATVYRTDQAGTVIVRTDGTWMDVTFEKTAIDGSGS